MGSGIGEDTSIQKDGNATHIQNAAQGKLLQKPDDEPITNALIRTFKIIVCWK